MISRYKIKYWQNRSLRICSPKTVQCSWSVQASRVSPGTQQSPDLVAAASHEEGCPSASPSRGAGDAALVSQRAQAVAVLQDGCVLKAN